MRKICFVCHGNICRSPMAEMIMKDLVRKENLSDQFFIDSRATTNDDTGAGIYYEAAEQLMEHHIPIDFHRARRLSQKDIDDFDEIYVMEDQNFAEMPSGLKNWKGKVRKLKKENIEDPWWTGRFGKVFDQIYQGCLDLLKEDN